MKAQTAKDDTPTMKKSGISKDEGNGKNRMQHVDSSLVTKAVSALINYHKEKVVKKESLLGDDRVIQVQFGLEVAPTQARKVVLIEIPNPIHLTAKTTESNDEGLEEPDVCLIVKDEAKPWIQEMVEEHNELMGCIKKVLTLDSLRKKHARFEQRRELLHKYDVFMADDRILPMLTSALGKDFIKAKKLPLPIKITRKVALPFAIQKNLSSTYMTICQGTSISIRAGNTGMPEKKLVQNIVAIAENAVNKIPRKWANIRSIAVKTPESTSLPFYHKLPEELVEIAKLAGIAPTFKPNTEDNNNKHGNSKQSSEGKSGNDNVDDDKDKDTDKDKDKDKDKGSPKRKLDLAAKSPLVRALKKQKRKEEAKEDGKTEGHKPTEEDAKAASKSVEKKDKKVSKKGNKESTTKNNKESTAEESEDMQTSSKSGKHKSKKAATPEKPVESETPNSSKAEKKKKRKESNIDDSTHKEESKSEEKKKKKRKEAESPASKDNSKLLKKQKVKDDAKDDFVACKKFKGSKEGYVFRRGEQGVGYYVDKKPVVDPLMLQALIRSASQGGGNKSRSKSRSGGKKRSGR